MNKKNSKSQALGFLRIAIENSTETRLPPMRELSKQWGISRGVISRAAEQLRAEGELSYAQGRRIHICGKMPRSKSVSQESPREAFSRRLYDSIADGSLQRGTRIPKLDAVCREHHVSKTTVHEVLREFESRNLVSKEGKGWFVGPRLSPRAHTGGFSPTIILIEDNERGWVSSVQAERTVRFPLQFGGEAQRFGVRLLSVFTGTHRTPLGAGYVGIEGVRKCIGDLGNAYIGALIVSIPGTNSQIPHWVTSLVRYKKPVVWFDRHDTPLNPKPSSPLYTRCHFSEHAGIQACIDYLYSMGHRRVVYPYLATADSEWEGNRGRLLVEEGKRKGVTVIVQLLKRSSTGSDELDGLLGRNLDNSRATAIVAPRDYTAVRYLYRLRHYGLDVPREISLISFDNSAHAQPTGITSVDFGFNHLGYSAFHLILKDVPVARTRAQAVPGKASVVRRSTVESVR